MVTKFIHILHFYAIRDFLALEDLLLFHFPTFVVTANHNER